MFQHLERKGRMGHMAVGHPQALFLEAEEDIPGSSTASGHRALPSGISAQTQALGLRACPAERTPDHCYPLERSPMLLEALRG